MGRSVKTMRDVVGLTIVIIFNAGVDCINISDNCPPANVKYSNLQPRIIGGQGARSGDFPWQAALFVIDDWGNELFKCGGSLISVNKVLTAAHCIEKMDGYGTIFVTFGIEFMSSERFRAIQTNCHE